MYRPVRTLKKVVLPAPFGPIRPYTWPGVIVMPTSDSACSPPKRFDTPLTRRMGSLIARSARSSLGRHDVARRRRDLPRRRQLAVRQANRQLAARGLRRWRLGAGGAKTAMLGRRPEP